MKGEKESQKNDELPVSSHLCAYGVNVILNSFSIDVSRKQQVVG